MNFRFNINGTVNINRIINISFAFDYLFVLLFALLPILMNYRGLIINASVTVVIVLLPYAVYKILTRRFFSVDSFRLLLPLALFWLFKVIDHGTSIVEVGQVFVYIVLFMAFASGCVDSKLLIKVSIGISCFATFCIICQYICYYILGFHLALVPTSFLLQGSQQWVQLAQTGTISVTGRTMSFYRPSSFFLNHLICLPIFWLHCFIRCFHQILKNTRNEFLFFSQ